MVCKGVLPTLADLACPVCSYDTVGTHKENRWSAQFLMLILSFCKNLLQAAGLFGKPNQKFHTLEHSVDEGPHMDVPKELQEGPPALPDRAEHDKPLPDQALDNPLLPSQVCIVVLLL